MTAVLRRAGIWAARVFVLLTVTSLVGLTMGQRIAGDGWWWFELSRYLPYYWIALPCLTALVLAFVLGRAWVALGVANLLLLAFVTTGFTWHAGAAIPDGAQRIRLMSYNIKAAQAMQRPGGVAALETEVRRHAPDIVVMQDAHGLRVERGAPAQVDGGALFGLPYVHALGQYIVASRYPLRACTPGQIGFRNESHRYLRCDVDIEGHALTVVTAHFQSPRGGLSATRREGLEGADEWQQNYQDRLTQARALARSLADIPRPLVVAGDLNAPESSPVVGTLLDTGLRDAFSSAGRGWGYTYGHTLKRAVAFLRIDHILVSADIGVAATRVGDGTASDHRPVIADIILRRHLASP